MGTVFLEGNLGTYIQILNTHRISQRAIHLQIQVFIPALFGMAKTIKEETGSSSLYKELCSHLKI